MHWIAWVNKFRCNSHVIAHKNTKHSTNRFKYEDYGQHYSTKVGLWYDQKTIHDEIMSKKAIFEPKKIPILILKGTMTSIFQILINKNFNA